MLVVLSLTATGLPSRILPLKWPSSISPLGLSNFETQARRLRYQALGRACMEDGCNVLFLAHHSDDHVETILMRLATGHKGAGLSGISSASSIPECWGMHGVHQSSRHEEGAATMHSQKRYISSSIDPLEQCQQHSPTPEDKFEIGGIQMIRPLLAFGKRQLVATCQAESVPWEEDITNGDVTQTFRNTARRLLLNDRLPQALCKDSLQGLATRSTVKGRGIAAAAKSYFKLCEIDLFEARSGLLRVRMPTIIKPEDYGLVNDVATCRRVAAVLVRLLAKLVSPLEEIPLEHLRSATEAIFPDLINQQYLVFDRCSQVSNCTTGGVHFRRVAKRLCWSKPSESRTLGLNEAPSHTLDHDFIWSLSRQAYPSPLKPWNVPISVGFSPWTLWDGRYWIRVLNANSESVVVRSLRANDLTHLRAILPKESWQNLHNLLAEVAPGKIRYTLPIVAAADDRNTGPGEVFVLPTLGPAGRLRRDLRVEVRYKAIDHLWKDKYGNQAGLDLDIRAIKTWHD